MEILREGERVWAGSASTSQLRRRFEDLAHYLFYADVHPDGIVLTTGTCLVPESPFTLGPGDEVRIEVAEVGLLRNHVVRGLEAFLAVAPASLLAAVEAT
ncbi:MAG: fumarylacetoacetate hydrolase [Acidimicrobiaceae bacterium]|nr:fumarylacetoacetate hydrolase [Acidimicrobiaceae bacterium]